MHRISRHATNWLVVAFMMAFGAAHAQEDEEVVSALHATNDIAWSQMTIRVVDEGGRPIEGAIVRPWGLRAGQWHQTWYGEYYGSPKGTKTNFDGKSTIDFPATSIWRDKPPVVQVALFVSHRDFCTESVHVSVTSDASVIPAVTLISGIRLRIAGVESGGDQPLSYCHVLLEDAESDDPEFTVERDGWLQSIPIRKDRRWFRVIRVIPGQPPQFSAPRTWTSENDQPMEMKVEVRPGVRVVGRVSDNVPRPIDKGRVLVCCGAPIQQSTSERKNLSQRIWWNETVSIQSDGSFEFPSLPSGYLAQFFTIAGEYISAQPPDEDYEKCVAWFDDVQRIRHAQIRYGQTLRLAGRKQETVLKMELAGKICVRCIDSNGRPLAGINVASWPNQYIIGAGSSILCSYRSSLEQLNGWGWTKVMRENPFTERTNADGEAILRSMPEGRQSVDARSGHRKQKQQELTVNVTAGVMEMIDVEMELAP